MKTYSQAQFGKHVYASNENGIDCIAKHGDGTRTVLTLTYDPSSGTDIASVAMLDD